MVEIECLACGKTLKIPKYIDADKYEGEIVCQECKARLQVKLVKGKAQKYKLVDRGSGWMRIDSPDDIELAVRQRFELAKDEQALIEKYRVDKEKGSQNMNS